ncbi:MAG: retroviral-like aspartic protease family protein [Acidobacteriia bacterium]|nr:retroviral-like aspartic protease family protein [Terriglobia bacterium]
MVDSGAADCMFPATIAEAIGIHDITTGRKDERLGIGGPEDVWLHPIVLYVGEHVLNIEAAFSRTLPVAGLLGRRGFFEHFKITFDPTSDPPGLEIERAYKA